MINLTIMFYRWDWLPKLHTVNNEAKTGFAFSWLCFALTFHLFRGEV